MEFDKIKTRQKFLNKDSEPNIHEIIGVSEPMKNVFATISKVAETDANVLILGENGTGKELVARALHKKSKRADEVFINVDMGSLTSTLFESELFGYVKGAFTDAKEDQTGKIRISFRRNIYFWMRSGISLSNFNPNFYL